MGMGLWICRAIAESYGGQLKAWSRIDGGSIFQIVLPMEKSGVAAAEMDAKAARR